MALAPHALPACHRPVPPRSPWPPGAPPGTGSAGSGPGEGTGRREEEGNRLTMHQRCLKYSRSLLWKCSPTCSWRMAVQQNLPPAGSISGGMRDVGETRLPGAGCPGALGLGCSGVSLLLLQKRLCMAGGGRLGLPHPRQSSPHLTRSGTLPCAQQRQSPAVGCRLGMLPLAFWEKRHAAEDGDPQPQEGGGRVLVPFCAVCAEPPPGSASPTAPEEPREPQEKFLKCKRFQIAHSPALLQWTWARDGAGLKAGFSLNEKKSTSASRTAFGWVLGPPAPGTRAQL